MKKLSFLILVITVLTGCQNTNLNEASSEARSSFFSSQSSNSDTTWKTYSSDKYHISFQYPVNWDIGEEVYGVVVRLVSPEITQKLEELRAKQWDIDTSLENLRFVYCESINTYCGPMYGTGRRDYQNLEDFIEDPDRHMEKVREYIVDGEKAFGVIDTYAFGIYTVMLERKEHIYIFTFPEYSGNYPSENSIENKIISSIQFND